jgi:hypothetical protein
VDGRRASLGQYGTWSGLIDRALRRSKQYAYSSSMYIQFRTTWEFLVTCLLIEESCLRYTSNPKTRFGVRRVQDRAPLQSRSFIMRPMQIQDDTAKNQASTLKRIPRFPGFQWNRALTALLASDHVR